MRRQVSKPRGAARARAVSNREIAGRAAPQHGIITRRQLVELGLTGAAIDHRLRAGFLFGVHRGVYAIGHRPPSPHARAMAAVLACGSGAVLSHRSASALWGLDARWRAAVDVTAPSERRHRGVRVHRSRTLTRRDVTVHFGIPVTTLARTLLDLADVLSDKKLARAVNEAQIQQRSTLQQLAALLARSPGRNTARLRPFVERAGPPTRSEFEDAFLAFAEHHGLQVPEVNQCVAGYEVDALWRHQRLAVELDSREFHDTDQAFEQDRDKDADLLVAGVRVIRLTWRRMTQTPTREARRLAALLALELR